MRFKRWIERWEAKRKVTERRRAADRMFHAALDGDEEASELIMLTLATEKGKGGGTPPRKWSTLHAVIYGPKALPTDEELERRLIEWADRHPG